jgi:hypothetical protein
MSATCFVLSVIISLAVFMLSPNPTDVGERCATSDQPKPIKEEQEFSAGEMPITAGAVHSSKKSGGSPRAASPARALKPKLKQPDLPLGGTFEARSPLQVSSIPCFYKMNQRIDVPSSTFTAASQSSTQDFHSPFGVV